MDTSPTHATGFTSWHAVFVRGGGHEHKRCQCPTMEPIDQIAQRPAASSPSGRWRSSGPQATRTRCTGFDELGTPRGWRMLRRSLKAWTLPRCRAPRREGPLGRGGDRPAPAAAGAFWLGGAARGYPALISHQLRGGCHEPFERGDRGCGPDPGVLGDPGLEAAGRPGIPRARVVVLADAATAMNHRPRGRGGAAAPRGVRAPRGQSDHHRPRRVRHPRPDEARERAEDHAAQHDPRPERPDRTRRGPGRHADTLRRARYAEPR